MAGPGGTSWGANAVNGVVNIITGSATETLGGPNLQTSIAVQNLNDDRHAELALGGNQIERSAMLKVGWLF